jgi:UDP-N-acetylglucosamine 1-carboxyvinyltransferase
MTTSDDIIRIQGGRPLRGAVELSGSKNGALPLLAATILVEGETILRNVPAIEDVFTMLDLLRALGLQAELAADGTARIVNHGPATHVAPPELVHKMRASFWVAGPLLSRLRQAEVALPGGCNLGSRPVDFHLRGFEALGAEVSLRDGLMSARAPRLSGAVIRQDGALRSVGATMNIAMAACLAEGTTIIENASREPEVVDLCRFLTKAGARITGVGADALRIDGVARLDGVEHPVLSDRIEAGTLLMAAAITGGEATLGRIAPEDLGAALDALARAGLEVRRGAGEVAVRAGGRARAVNIATAPFPGFPTDLQPPMTALLCLAEGTSVVEETIYDGRLGHAEELRKMGAEIEATSRRAVIRGVERLRGATLHAHNIRAGAAVVLAALAAEGESRVLGRHVIDRGYQRFEEKLAGLGACIEIIPNGERGTPCSG